MNPLYTVAAVQQQRTSSQEQNGEDFVTPTPTPTPPASPGSSDFKRVHSDPSVNTSPTELKRIHTYPNIEQEEDESSEPAPRAHSIAEAGDGIFSIKFNAKSDAISFELKHDEELENRQVHLWYRKDISTCQNSFHPKAIFIAAQIA